MPMIVSHRHRFVFTAIPKTGTHSVRAALREHMAPGDMEQVGLFVDKRLPYPELASLQHGHLGLAQLRPHLGEDAFASYFKFAFVRNPFDRFVSYCAFMTREHGQFEKNPRSVMRHFIDNPPWQHILFQPQHSFVTNPEGQLLTDYLGRVEEMQSSYDEAARRIGIPSAPLEKVNASQRRDYRDYYEPALIDGVAKLYARDLELFGYEF
jgi:sulfotransferase famil protein